MRLEPTTSTLADHAAIHECLSARGFQRTGASVFSNGRATVRFEGAQLAAIPGDGSRTWRSDISATPPEAIVTLLNVVLVIPAFLTQRERDQRAGRAHGAKIALDRIVDVIREAPERACGRELRGFLWSLFNAHHVMNLWGLRDDLGPQRGAGVTEVFTAWMASLVPDGLPPAGSDTFG